MRGKNDCYVYIVLFYFLYFLIILRYYFTLIKNACLYVCRCTLLFLSDKKFAVLRPAELNST